LAALRQRRAIDAERARGLREHATRALELGLDQLPLVVEQRVVEAALRGLAVAIHGDAERVAYERRIDLLARRREDEHVLDRMLELANVAGPRVRLEHGDRSRREAGNGMLVT